MPSLTNYPNARPSLFLDFANSRQVDPRIEFSRATTATRTNAKGVIETVAANVPRIDYDPLTGECLGLWVEGASTNLAVQSEFSTGLPAANGGAVTPTSFPGFAGGISFALGAVPTYAYRSPSLPAAGTPHTLSVLLRMDDGGAPVVGSTQAPGFDLALVVAGGAGAYGGLRHLGGGLYLAWSTHNTPASTSNWGVIKHAAQSARGFKVTGYQIEASPFPTSYIPTTTAAATRVADIPQMTGGNFSDWYRQEQGTVIVEFGVPYLASAAYQTALGFFEASGNGAQASVIQKDLTNKYGAYTRDAGLALQANIYVGGVVVGGDIYRIASAYKDSDFAATMNGGAPAVDVSGAVPLATRLCIGTNGSGLSAVNGHIRRIAYYPTRLPNAQLQALTAS